MAIYYELLGITPTANTEEIEAAYKRKKEEFMGEAEKLQELDSAYNEAIMATFAPIRAFASPLPPLQIGKAVKPAAPQPQIQPKVEPRREPQEREPQELEPVDTQLEVERVLLGELNEQPTIKSQPAPSQPTYAARHAGGTGMPFSDTQIMDMDVSDIRNHMPQEEDTEEHEPFLGIENKLLGYYVKTFLAVVVFDIIMRLLFGPAWLVLTEAISAEQIPATSRLLLIPLAFVSIAYCFICALPMPSAVRFFVLGQPPDKTAVMWTLFFISITLAFLLHWLTGRILPYNITGSSASLIIVASALSFKTLQYEES